MNRTCAFLILVTVIAAVVGCKDKNPAPAEVKGDAPKDTKEGPTKTVYFKNPAPPFAVELGEVDVESPAAVLLDKNHLQLPVLYREWIYIGSRLVAGTQSTFENYYLHPRHYHEFRQNHAWPERMVVVRESVVSKSRDADVIMGEMRGISVAVRDTKVFADKPGGWAFYDFGTSYPLATSAAPDGRAWFESADALLEFCPILRGMKR
ncbi:MAG: cytochrome P460 family protein [Pirellulales bacterium]|nr:cytochrome P460 family protein [Pirellulales bacterium]